jgi:hypothetical protein
MMEIALDDKEEDYNVTVFKKIFEGNNDKIPM